MKEDIYIYNPNKEGAYIVKFQYKNQGLIIQLNSFNNRYEKLPSWVETSQAEKEAEKLNLKIVRQDFINKLENSEEYRYINEIQETEKELKKLGIPNEFFKTEDDLTNNTRIDKEEELEAIIDTLNPIDEAKETKDTKKNKNKKVK